MGYSKKILDESDVGSKVRQSFVLFLSNFQDDKFASNSQNVDPEYSHVEFINNPGEYPQHQIFSLANICVSV